jgi:hypothetical protein
MNTRRFSWVARSSFYLLAAATPTPKASEIQIMYLAYLKEDFCCSHGFSMIVPGTSLVERRLVPIIDPRRKLNTEE